MTELHSAVILVLFMAGIFLCEKRFPARELPQVKGWWTRVAFLQAAVMLVITFGVSSWQESLMRFRLLDGAPYLSPLWGGITTYLVGTFIFYWWHRIRHESNFFWFTFHQVHHSPSRIHSFTAFYVHPAEAVVSSLINATLVFVIFGLNKEALIVNATLMALNGIFYHSNISTPQWLGYIIQRPEMHACHHEINVHARNYGDITIWDICFGTFYNPVKFNGVMGFEPGRELRFGDLLLARDVNKVV